MNFIDTYNEAEKRALARSTFTERKIFAPVTHNIVNDPTRISSISELPYFVCTMQNDRAEDTVDNLLNGLTADEGRLLERILIKVLEVSSTWGVRTASHSSVLRHMYQRRLMRHLLPSAQSFLEIGPGAGYLSLMLALDGNAVANTDVTQAYYIFQHYLYSSFGVQCEWADKAETDNKPTACGETSALGRIQHIPWWIYKDLATGPIRIDVDVIVVNHAICEMHQIAVQHLRALAQRLGCPKFFMEGTGLPPTFNEITSQFLAYGYSIRYSKQGVYVFEHNVSARSRAMNVGNRVVKKLVRLAPFSSIIKQESLRLRSEWTSLRRLMPQRRSIIKSIFSPNRIRYSDVSKLYNQILGSSNFRSLDEEFQHRIRPG